MKYIKTVSAGLIGAALLVSSVFVGCTPLNIHVEKSTEASEQESTETETQSGLIRENRTDAEAETEIEGAFREYTEDFFAYLLEGSTLNIHYFVYDAEQFGLDPYEAVWAAPNADPEEISTYYSEIREWRDGMSEYPYEELTEEGQLTYDCMAWYLDNELESEGFEYYYEPLGQTTGVQANLPIELANYRFDTNEDITTYLELLKGVQQYFEDIMAYEHEKADAGLFMEDRLLSEVISQCEQFAKSREESFLYDTFDDRLSMFQMSDERKAELQKANREAVESFYDAYDYLISELHGMEGTEGTKGGLINLPKGKEYYEYLIRTRVGTDMTPDELITAIDRKLEDGISEMRQIYRENPNIYDSLDGYRYQTNDPKVIMNQLISDVSEDFPALDTVSYRFSYVDPSLREYLSPAFYFVTPVDNDTMNTIYINAEPREEEEDIFHTLAHEGYPGHLYQSNYLKQHSTYVLRQLLSTNGFTEGYAEYVEELSYDYLPDASDAMKRMMQLNSNVSLCIYARTDLGIHYEGWGIDEIESYVSDYFDGAREVAEWMYDHILGDPGGYLDYMVGSLEVEALKETAEGTYNYSPMKFHTALLDLSGAPFSIIRERMFEN